MKCLYWLFVSTIFIWMIAVFNPPFEHGNFLILVILMFWSFRVLAVELHNLIEDDDSI